MKILLVNKFLYHKGGAENYVIKLGKFLKEKNNEVQYFGLENSNNTLSNDYNLYAKDIDFQKKNIKVLLSFIRIIHNHDAQKKMYKLLKQFKPDIIILNNIEYHLTPSIILAIGKYKNKINKKAIAFYVAHDYQLICPSHGLFDTDINPCEKCLQGNYWNCYKTKCLKNSKIKSLIGTIDSWYWHKRKVYKYIDYIICPSNFMKQKLDTHNEFKDKTIVIHNFIDNQNKTQDTNVNKKDYIIYFGKLCKDKGVETLLKAVKMLPKIKFVFAGYGPLENEIKKIKNAEYIGFKEDDELQSWISCAKLSICPSEWYENCPFSVIEAQMYGTPVLGSNMGGIPELIEIGKTGEIFQAKNIEDLKNKILMLWNDKDKLTEYSKNCNKMKCETLESYTKKLFEICKINEVK